MKMNGSFPIDVISDNLLEASREREKTKRRKRVVNPYDAIEVTINVLLGAMRHSTGDVSDEQRQKFESNQFLKIASDPNRHTMLRAKDGAIVGYHVPGSIIDGETLTKGPKSLIKTLP
jgi:hypothetical protein